MAWAAHLGSGFGRAFADHTRAEPLPVAGPEEDARRFAAANARLTEVPEQPLRAWLALELAGETPRTLSLAVCVHAGRWLVAMRASGRGTRWFQLPLRASVGPPGAVAQA